MARQLTFDLPHRSAMGRDDFLVADGNAAAVKLIDDWPNWPSQAALIIGPAGSGKSHLATVWQARSAAKLLPLCDLRIETVPEVFAAKAVVLEDAEAGDVPEQALFHLLNLARQESGHVLLTSEMPPAAWGIALPDLASRLKTLTAVAIASPDDSLLRGVLVKHFTDRQIAVDESVVSYILLRMPRSLAAAREVVAQLDARALEEGAAVTRPFVARVLPLILEPGIFPAGGGADGVAKSS